MPRTPKLVLPHAVVLEARTWLQTPWQHQGRLKGIGVDCIGLVIEVSRALGLLEAAGLSADWQFTAYARQPAYQELAQILGGYCTRVSKSARQIGDVVMFAGTVVLGHVATPTEKGQPFGLLHSFAARGKLRRRVIEHRLSGAWVSHIVATFRLPGVATWPA